MTIAPRLAWKRSPNGPAGSCWPRGETVRKRSVEARDDLTPQERHIAELARDGLSNPEIGERIFLSRRTVERHLRHVFAKLGIRSRRGLSSALGHPVSEPLGTTG
jgi:DNA-binding NarL/FixJ family response regulator